MVNTTLIRPVLLYDSKTWVLTKREENRLLVFEGKVYPKIVDGLYRSRYNFELDGEFNSPNVIGVVKSNRLRNVGERRDSKDLGTRNWTNFARYRVQLVVDPYK
jgi:hypothetical protein